MTTKLVINRIFIILAIMWMLIIFCFSAQEADTSQKESNAVGFLIGRIVVLGFDDLPESEQLAFAEKWSFVIRKGAHMTEYAILGMLLCGALTRRRFLYAFIITVLYAASDEFHQMFVPGRAGMIRDIGIDAIGAAVGIALLYILSQTLAHRERP